MTGQITTPPFSFAADHPADILRALADRLQHEPCALVVVTGTVGGAVRDNGALMIVPEVGAAVGYVSNGCVDADVIAHARAALETGKPLRLRYGQGSPFMDIRLPCGGAIDLLVLPSPAPDAIAEACARLAARKTAILSFDASTGEVALRAGETAPGWSGDTFTTTYSPPIRLRIAGRGPEALAVARLAATAGFGLLVQSPDGDVLAAAEAMGADTMPLKDVRNPPKVTDDAWTAFILLFHDHDWETELLRQAVAGGAFYIGALGSRRTHDARLDRLRQVNVGEADCSRIKGPIGLVPAQRNASGLAISVLADIVAASGNAKPLA